MPFRTWKAREKPVSGPKASKDSLIPLLGIYVLGAWSWNQRSFITPQILAPWLCSINGRAKPRWQRVCSQHGLLNVLSPLLRPTAQKKKKRFLSKYYWSLTRYLFTQELWWRWTERLMLFSNLLTQHPFFSPQIKESLQLSSPFINKEIHFRSSLVAQQVKDLASLQQRFSILWCRFPGSGNFHMPWVWSKKKKKKKKERNLFHKVIAAIVIPLIDLGKVNWKLYRKDSPL